AGGYGSAIWIRPQPTHRPSAGPPPMGWEGGVATEGTSPSRLSWPGLTRPPSEGWGWLGPRVRPGDDDGEIWGRFIAGRLTLIRPSGTFSHQGRRPPASTPAVGNPSPW